MCFTDPVVTQFVLGYTLNGPLGDASAIISGLHSVFSPPPYTVGVGNIYSDKDIEIAKRSSSFEKEYNLKFLGQIGNVFLSDKIDEAIELGRKMDTYNQILNNPKLTPDSQFYIGVDSGFGSSAFAIVLVMILDEVICVLETKEIFRQQFSFCINEIASMMIKYRLNSNNTKVLVDASAPSVVSALKSQMNESTEYLPLLDHRKKMKMRRHLFRDDRHTYTVQHG
jgi:hypothetical protein